MRVTSFALAVAAFTATGFAPSAGAHAAGTTAVRHCVVWIAPASDRAP